MTYYTAQGTLLSTLHYPLCEKNLKDSGYMNNLTDSICCMPEANTTLNTNYTPPKI